MLSRSPNHMLKPHLCPGRRSSCLMILRLLLLQLLLFIQTRQARLMVSDMGGRARSERI